MNYQDEPPANATAGDQLEEVYSAAKAHFAEGKDLLHQISGGEIPESSDMDAQANPYKKRSISAANAGRAGTKTTGLPSYPATVEVPPEATSSPSLLKAA